MTFGHGFRACPGSNHALALAAGVVETVLARCDAASDEFEYEPSPNLRVPAALVVTVR
jgi:cytochrome P450